MRLGHWLGKGLAEHQDIQLGKVVVGGVWRLGRKGRRSRGCYRGKQVARAGNCRCLAKGFPNKVLMEIFPRGLSKGTPHPSPQVLR